MISNILGKPLSIVNSAPPWFLRDEFYRVKDRILKLCGRKVGEDLQHIYKECWHCNRWDCYNCEALDGKCCKCLDTGIYRQFWSRLAIYRVGRYRFHLPIEKLYEKPSEPVTITDYIKHEERGTYEQRCELALWLILFFDPLWLLKNLRKAAYHPTMAKYPMCALLTAIGWLRMKWRGMTKRFEKPEDIPF